MSSLFVMNEGRVLDDLEQATRELESGAEVILDFSSVRRIEAAALKTMEQLAVPGNVVLRGVNVDVYRVLKLMKLAPRFSFVH